LLWISLLAATLLAGCARSATQGGDGEIELSESEQIELELEHSVGFVDDPELLAYVETIGRRIVEQGKRSEIDYRFYILDMPIPNALALPEGQIFVSRGVLVLVNSEDELAGILAHEVAHVEERHADERQGLAIVTSPIRLGTGIAGWATGLIIPGLGDAIVELGESTQGLVLAPYSRDQEREADRVGQSLAAAAGYDPDGLVNLLDTMANAEALTPENARERSFFDSHPTTDERVELTREHGGTLSPGPRPATAKDRREVLAVLQGLVIGEDPGKGFFDDNWFVHPVLEFAMAFPPNWDGINAGGFVGAQAPDEETFVMLALVGKGSDPLDGAKAASKTLEVDVVADAQVGTLNGLDAAKNRAQITGPDGEIQKVELTWIAHGGLIYQVMGVAAIERFDAVAELMAKSAHSFRPLTAEELSGILVAQLVVVEGREGESIASLAERAGSPWTVEAIAVVNRRSASAPLDAGELMKVGVQKSYAVRRPEVREYAAEPARVIDRRQ
jgi:predicted Zn-dependent protease